PLKKLPCEGPLDNIFNLYVLLSVLIQFVLHIVPPVYITNLSHAYEPYVFFQQPDQLYPSQFPIDLRYSSLPTWIISTSIHSTHDRVSPCTTEIQYGYMYCPSHWTQSYCHHALNIYFVQRKCSFDVLTCRRAFMALTALQATKILPLLVNLLRLNSQ
ncbi:hypothetical protein BJ138DRAFT_1017055, partial [Hygrophoropsis aurantiaca]